MQPRPAFARVSATLWSDDSEIILWLAERGLALTRRVPGRSRRAALYRSLSWPVIDGLPRELEVSSPGRMLVDTGDVVGRVLAASGVWEPHVTDAFRGRFTGRRLRRRRRHLGYYTLLASQLVGGRGHVYAFEPSLGIFRRLQANLALNGVTNVSALNVAAGAEASSARAVRAGRRLRKREPQSELLDSPHAAPAEYTGVAVEVRTVESAIPSVELERVRVVRSTSRLRGGGAPWSRASSSRNADRVVRGAEPGVEPRRPGAVPREPVRPVRAHAVPSRERVLARRVLPEAHRAPERIEAIPSRRCDLMLVRGPARSEARSVDDVALVGIYRSRNARFVRDLVRSARASAGFWLGGPWTSRRGQLAS